MTSPTHPNPELDLDELETLAKTAAQGKRIISSKEDIDFQAALTPQTVLDLIESARERDDLREQVEELSGIVDRTELRKQANYEEQIRTLCTALEVAEQTLKAIKESNSTDAIIGITKLSNKIEALADRALTEIRKVLGRGDE